MQPRLTAKKGKGIMSSDRKVVFHQIDFLLPVHRFNIKFSYVTKKRLTFIREFVLRLIHLAPMKTSQLAEFFDFSKHEINVALSDLVDIGDISYTETGLVALTNQSRQYFSQLGAIPEQAAIMEYSGVFAFELASFKCIGRKRTKEKWRNGLSLNVSNESVANSERLTHKSFQKQFHQMLEHGYMSHLVETDESKRPSLYKMDSVKKVGKEPLRIEQKFALDITGNFMERDDIEVLEDDAKAQELITETIHQIAPSDNSRAVIDAMVEFADRHTGKYLTDNSVDIQKLLSAQSANTVKTAEGWPFIGPLYLAENWLEITKHLEPVLAQMKSTHLDGVDEFTWLAPSNEYWGQSIRLNQCFVDLVDKAKTKGKKSKTLYQPKIYVPLQCEDDKRVRNQWIQSLGDNAKFVNGIMEGFFHGHVEVLLLPRRFVAVCYHVSRPHINEVSIPIGFMSTNHTTIARINNLVQEYISGFIEHGRPNDFGSI